MRFILPILLVSFLFLSLTSIFCIFPTAVAAYTETAMDKKGLFKVTKVVDGDTITVSIRGKNETVRLLGIDTPETVDPRKPVQCFGKAASDKMKSVVLNQYVKLVDDSTQGNRDVYNRLLRYVYLSNGTFVNGEMIRQGYAFSFKEYPTKMLSKFNEYEKYARDHKLGLWGSCSLQVTPTKSAVKTPTKSYSGPTRIYIVPTAVPAVNQSTSVSTGDKDCGDFATHAEAQAFFLSQGGPGSDPHKLDADHDGEACETLP